MLGWSLNLFRVRGIQLALHWTFLLLLAYAAQLGYQQAGLAGLGVFVGLLLAFFTCVVLHEFGHSLTALRFGIGVRRILLTPLGGMAEFDSIPRQPRLELLITLAGPAVNFVIAGLCWLAIGGSLSRSETLSTWRDFTELLLSANLLMGTFNLLPAFPMDGGRILRALLALKLPYLKATFWAATVGKVVTALGFAAALYLGSYRVAVLFAFIFMGGEQEYRAVKRREEFEAHWRETLDRLNALHVPPEEPPLL